MTRPLILVALVALAACDTAGTTTASAPRGSAESRFVTAMENNGCIMNQANAGKIIQESMLTGEEIKSVVEDLANAGKIEKLVGDTLRLTSGGCSL